MSKQDLFKILKSKIGKDSESEVCLFLEHHCIVQTVYLGQYYFSSNISMANISILSLYCANGVYLGHPRSRGRLPLMPHATLYSIVEALSSSHRLRHYLKQPHIFYLILINIILVNIFTLIGVTMV